MSSCKGCKREVVDLGFGYFCSEACRAEFRRPAPGKAATYSIGSDYYPYTIVAVSKAGTKLTVRRDSARRGVFEPATGEDETAFRGQDGTYRLTGRYGRLTVGERTYDMDPSF